jgi:hypothetical protein
VVGGNQEEGAPLEEWPASSLRQRPLYGVWIGRSNLGQARQEFVGGDAHVLESATTDISKE